MSGNHNGDGERNGLSPRMVDVLLVDDHELVRIGIRGLLESRAAQTGIHVVGEAGSGEEALTKLPRLRPDVVLLDLNMPGMGGLETTRQVLAQYPGTKVIVLTVQDEGPFPRWLMDSGASGYLTKGCQVDELIEAIRLAMRGDRHMSPKIAHHLSGGEGAEEADALARLSPRERQILVLLVKGCKQQKIASELGVNVKTVSTYKARLRDKLECSSDIELLRLAMDHGITAPDSSNDA